MADDYKVSNKLPAAAAASSSLPVSTPLPGMHDVVVKQIKLQSLLPAAVLVVVDVKPPPASPVAAVLPPADDEKTPPPPAVSNHILLLLTVCIWVVVHAVAFTIAILIADLTPCNKLTWLQPPCVAMTDAAAAELSALLHGELWCIIAAEALVMPLPKLLTDESPNVAAAAVDALAWLALAATAGIHCTHLASDRVYLAADPGKMYFFVEVVLVSGCLTVDVVLAGFLLCCRR